MPQLLVVFLVLLALTAPAAAASADKGRCLNRTEQRAAIASGHAIQLGVVRRMLRHRTSGEIVRARLCYRSAKLIYLLTVLARDGKVRIVTVDASNGTVVGGL
jgi:uncharacterized membrane protein YkoI